MGRTRNVRRARLPLLALGATLQVSGSANGLPAEVVDESFAFAP